MITALVKKFFRFFGLEIQRIGLGSSESYSFLRKKIYQNSRGILHIGAHYGQEAEMYDRAGARVLWIEAIPEVFDKLKLRIKNFPKQRAILACLGDEEKQLAFHVSDNEGQSSSIFNLGAKHRFPTRMISEVSMKMQRLDSLLTEEDVAQYPHWVVDVQGAELQALVGAGHLLDYAMTLDVEVSTRETYKGGTKLVELESFLETRGFVPLWNFADNSHGNLLFLRANARTYGRKRNPK